MKLTPRLWIGRRLSDGEATEAVRQGVAAVLDLTAEFSEAKPFREVQYLNVPILDLTAPMPEQLKRCLDFIAENAAGIVYIHCKIGYSPHGSRRGGVSDCSRRGSHRGRSHAMAASGPPLDRHSPRSRQGAGAI